MKSKTLYVLILLLTSGVGCKPDRSRQRSTAEHVEIRLWHTFNPEETEVLNALLVQLQKEHPEWKIRSRVIPFAHAQNSFIGATTRCGPDSPDVFRAELPWLAGFVEKKLIRPLPHPGARSRLLLASAAHAASYRGRLWALPTSIDGLALLYNKKLVQAPPPRTLHELVARGRELTIDRKGRNAADPRFDPQHAVRWGFYVRADGYWFLPFLWAHGGRLLDPHRKRIFVDQPRAVAALTFYRDLVRKAHIAPPHLRLSNDYEDQLKRFGRGEVAMMINGPWATRGILKHAAFHDPTRLGVAPFPLGPSKTPAAPMSGHGYVVTKCSRRPKQAWQVVDTLSDVVAQIRFATAAGLLPALKAAYDAPELKKDRLVLAFKRALLQSRARPQHPVMARIFDDFTPAVQAVLLGDASPKEALGGVARAWRRLLGIKSATIPADGRTPATAPRTGRPDGPKGGGATRNVLRNGAR